MIENPETFADAMILIIDDEATQRLLTRNILERDGFRVEEAPDGEVGLRRISELRPDLVLLDVMMPGIDGFELCRRLRADPAINHTPVIIVTGREDTEDIRKGFAAGATDFLTKPVVWNLLPNRVRYVLRTSRLEQELREAKEEAEMASEAKSTLLATMGHELRTPLNAIMGFADLMRQKAFGPIGSPQYEEFIIDIHDSGTRLLDCINAILEMVNCQSGNLVLDDRNFGLVQLVGSVVAQISPEAEATGVQVANDVSDETIDISGDEKRLHDAVFNLISNAVKFSEIGGTVRVTASRSEDGGLVLTISDDGIGISAEDLPRIFEPFEQADNGLARKFEGMGLGVPLARAFVQLHGGEIDYESELGKGTTVRITLPPVRLMTLKERQARTA